MSSTVKRFAGSGTRICLSRSLQSRDTLTCGGNSYSTRSILCVRYYEVRGCEASTQTRRMSKGTALQCGMTLAQQIMRGKCQCGAS